MKYRIGEVAELFKMTKGGIRFLEDRGFIQSKRDQNNSYRYYERFQITYIKQLRNLQALGFSLVEADELIKSGDCSHLIECMQLKQSELNHEIENLNRRIQVLKSYCSKLKKLEKHDGDWIVAKRPAMYRISVWEDLGLEEPLDPAIEKDRKEAEAAFISCIPLVSLSLLVRKQDDDFMIARGSCIEENDARKAGTEVNSQMDYYPECTDCYYSVVPSDGIEFNTQKLFQKIDHMKEHGESLVGDIIGRVVWGGYKDNHPETLNEFWIPFK